MVIRISSIHYDYTCCQNLSFSSHRTCEDMVPLDERDSGKRETYALLGYKDAINDDKWDSIEEVCGWKT